MRTVQFINPCLKIKNFCKCAHQNFNNFIDVNSGCSAQVFWPETFLCKGRFLIEMKINPNFWQMQFKTLNFFTEITVRRVSRWYIYIEILWKLGNFYCTYTLIPIFWKVLDIRNKKFGLFYLFREVYKVVEKPPSFMLQFPGFLLSLCIYLKP